MALIAKRSCTDGSHRTTAERAQARLNDKFHLIITIGKVIVIDKVYLVNIVIKNKYDYKNLLIDAQGKKT